MPRDRNGRFTHGLMDSLKQQLRAKGHDENAAHALAIEIMTKQGTLDADGNLTDKGRERERLGREGRAVDRMAKQTGRPHSEMVYDKRQRRAFVK